MIIHCTKKFAAKLPEVSSTPLQETSPLGSWHANLLYFDRRQCVMFCHDPSRAVLFTPGLRKPEFQSLGIEIFPRLLTETLLALGCDSRTLPSVSLALGRVQLDTATDRSVLSSMKVAKDDLEVMVYRVANVLDLDPVEVSAQISQRPATIAKKWLHPDEELLKRVKAL